MGEPICKKSRLTQRSWALPHGSSRHSPSGVSSASVLVPSGRQRTGVQVGDGGGLWDEKVLGDVAPVTGPRRAVTHCDRTCTNAQRPNSPHKSSAIQIAARCRQQRQLPSRRRHRLPATSPVRADYAPQPTHTPSTDPREPSSLHQPAVCTANAPSRRAPSIANPIEVSSWLKHLRFRDLPHKVAQSIHFAQEG